MRDIFSEGLLYLDLLEVYGSTYAVADICGISQSNVFRGANACAKLLRLDLAKNKQTGTYSVHKNHDVQRDLRRVNQRLRGRENGQMRLLASSALPSTVSPTAMPLLMSLPALSIDIADQIEFLRNGIIDLLIIGRHELPLDADWQPSPARSDLFSPACGGLVASLIGREPYSVLASANHPFRSLDRVISTSDFDSLEISLVEEPSLLAWQTRFSHACLPSTCSHVHYQASAEPTAENQQPWWQSLIDDSGSTLLVVPDFYLQRACGPDPSVLSMRMAAKIDPPLIDVVAVSVPHLVREPLFRDLIQVLRDAYAPPRLDSME